MPTSFLAAADDSIPAPNVHLLKPHWICTEAHFRLMHPPRLKKCKQSRTYARVETIEAIFTHPAKGFWWPARLQWHDANRRHQEATGRGHPDREIMWFSQVQDRISTVAARNNCTRWGDWRLRWPPFGTALTGRSCIVTFKANSLGKNSSVQLLTFREWHRNVSTRSANCFKQAITQHHEWPHALWITVDRLHCCPSYSDVALASQSAIYWWSQQNDASFGVW